MKLDPEINHPMTAEAFEQSDAEKIKSIEYHFGKIMETMGLDLSDDSLKDTPGRVAKMYVKELFSGLNPINKPEVTLFDNTYNYTEMLLEKNITFFSNCEHHFVPIFGRAHVAYISSGKIIGLSKLNRIVNYFSRRPQVQERLTMQIAKDLQEQLQTEDVAILMDARHFCVASRGIKDSSASTVTSFYGGKFKDEVLKKEFMNAINLKEHY
ncbi:GTP cyclohydrolase I FolE [Sphingobacteriaceae bacterium]|nr:GTP cyclohydrolase I FolE [Sphingobacteriaceae bacterium]